MPQAMDAYNRWLAYAHLDEQTRAELEAIRNNPQEIADRFWRGLSFGTGGLRGIMGAGTNRVNAYTVAKVTRGFAKYLNSISELPSCAIGYDSRNGSRAFAQLAAAVLAEKGVRVHLFEELVPTPMLSFAVRYLRCDGGVMITASHNPSDYNGYKVYDRTGCQVSDAVANEIADHIARQSDLVMRLPDFAEYQHKGHIRAIGRDVGDAFQEAVLQHSLLMPPAPLHVVYTPLHGAGNRPVRRMLGSLPNIRVSVVPQQENPDGDFPTAPKPNPENPQAMALAVQLMEELEADICLATDPDCDRLGVGVRTREGSVLLTGNQVGVLLFHFICEGRTVREDMPQGPVAIRSIVTTPMADVIAQHYGVQMVRVLTGFKYIGDKINRLAREGMADRFLFAFEESIGYLIGTYARDKDAVGAAMMVCEMASYYRSLGMDLVAAYQALEERWGIYLSALESIRFEGAQGAADLKRVMEALRQQEQIIGLDIVERVDYLTGETDLPPSDVLTFRLAGGRHLAVRPSGTEPLLKLYLTLQGKESEQAQADMDAFRHAVRAMIDSLV